jgi:hypothetical protein
MLASQLALAPVPQVVGIKRDAEEIRWDETKLRGSHGNHADDHAVRARYQPPLPKFSSDKNGREDCKNTGNVIESKHVGLYRRGFMTACSQTSNSGFRR